MARRRKVKGLSFYKKQKTVDKNIIHEIFSWAFIILISIIMGLIVTFAFGFSTRVLGVSMSPTLVNGQQILINRIKYSVMSPSRNEVIIFKLHADEESNYYIKRVIGIPGDTVQIIDGRVFVNGERMHESSAFDKMADAGIAYEPVKVGENEFFVLGDNRNNSEDSRNSDIGLITTDMITGKVWFAMAAGGNGMSVVK